MHNELKELDIGGIWFVFTMWSEFGEQSSPWRRVGPGQRHPALRRRGKRSKGERVASPESARAGGLLYWGRPRPSCCARACPRRWPPTPVRRRGNGCAFLAWREEERKRPRRWSAPGGHPCWACRAGGCRCWGPHAASLAVLRRRRQGHRALAPRHRVTSAWGPP